MDKIICKGIPCETEIGFKDQEQNKLQKLVVDFAAILEPIDNVLNDNPQTIRLDYFEAYKDIKSVVANKKFNLIEAVAEQIAHQLLDNYDIEEIEVTVTKKPMGMEDIDGVSYVCHRLK